MTPHPAPAATPYVIGVHTPGAFDVSGAHAVAVTHENDSAGLGTSGRALLRAAGFEPWGHGGWIRDDEGGGTCYDDMWALSEAIAWAVGLGGTVANPGNVAVVPDVITVQRISDTDLRRYVEHASGDMAGWADLTTAERCQLFNDVHRSDG